MTPPDPERDPPWAREESRWRTGVEKVRAGRPLRPARWPDGARVCAALSFDSDHDLLRRHDIRATFFVPGVVARLHPDEPRGGVGEGHELTSELTEGVELPVEWIKVRGVDGVRFATHAEVAAYCTAHG
jgi:hypothetical protein